MNNPTLLGIAAGTSSLMPASCRIAALMILAVSVSADAGHLDVTVFPSPDWVKEPGIRLDFDANDPPGTVGFHTPYVFRFPDGTLRMYYDAFGSGQMRSATSVDGLIWTKEPGVILSGFGLGHPHVLETSPGLFRIYFEGSGGGVDSAISTDGLNWTVEPGARVSPGVDPVVVELPAGGLRMYYRLNVPDTNIRSATSVDGLSWTVEAGIRISNAREFAAIRLPDNTVVIYYGQGSPDFVAILSARSPDGLNFTAEPGARLLPGNHPDSDPLDSVRVLTTSIVQFPGGVVRMYYQGSPSPNINNPARVFSAVAVVEPGVALDIKPGSCPNSFNRNSHGVLPVGLLGTADFDVTQVEISSVVISRDGVDGSASPNEGPPGPHSVFEDVGTPFDGETCDCHELQGDGIIDLSMKFRTQDVVEALELDDLLPGALVELCVSGTLLDGTPFRASDCIRLVPPGTPPVALAVQANVPGVFVDVAPLDLQLGGGGFANFERTFPLGSVVTLTASETHLGWVFAGWRVGGLKGSRGAAALQGDGRLKGADSIAITIRDDQQTVEAIYVPLCHTDITGDGVVNVLDLIDLLLCFGLPAVPDCSPEDVNGDGIVNLLDLIDLLLAFGATCP